MFINKIIPKRNLFDVLNIDRNDPKRYEKVVDYISSYDDRLCIEVFDSHIMDDKYIEDRLLDRAENIKNQFLEIYKNRKQYFSGCCYGYYYFEERMKKMGINDYTIEDWTHIAAICFERELNECPTLCSSIKCLASYVGYIDIQDEEYQEMLPLLQTFKEVYMYLNTIDWTGYNLNVANMENEEYEELTKKIINNEGSLEKIVSEYLQKYEISKGDYENA